MQRCAADTKAGRRCLNHALEGRDFCATHRDNVSVGSFVAAMVGGMVGNAIAPGLGGKILGAIAGPIIIDLIEGSKMGKKAVFVSFDFDNDRVLKDFIVGQARHPDSPFDIIDHSLKEAAPERNWEAKARAAVGRADIVLVMVGPQTYRAQGVLKEIAMAREAGIKIVQVIGYQDGAYTAVPNAGRLYDWNWPNLKNLLS